MKTPIPFLLVLVIVLLSKTLFGQSAENAAKFAQVKIMVIPANKPGDDLRTMLAANPNLNALTDKVKDALEKRGFTVLDFEKSLSDATAAQKFKAKAPADIKNTFIEFSGADIYVDAGIKLTNKGGTNKVEVLLNAFDAATAKRYASITCDSRERNNNDIELLQGMALQLTVPPKDLFDDDNKKRSTIPCIDEFLNNLQTSLTDDVIKKMVDKRNSAATSANQDNCQLANLKAEHELLQHNYEAARNLLLTITPENGQCYSDAQKRVADLFKQQFGSLDKASIYYQKEAIKNPDNKGAIKNLNLVNQLIEVRNQQDKTPPEIVLQTPKAIQGQDVEADVSSKGEIYVSGFVNDLSGVKSVSVNGNAVTYLKSDGFFCINIRNDSQDIQISATDKKGINTKKVFHIAKKADAKAFANDTFEPIQDDEDYHAIFIANGNYTNMEPLNTVKEEKKLMNLLIAKYNFKPANIDTLFNKSLNEIVNTLMDKLSALTEKDNLIIYYGGHGDYDETNDKAYWIPINVPKDRKLYFSNQKLDVMLTDCKAHHILVIADACYSGAFRGGEDAPSQIDFKQRSCQLLASGGVEKVPVFSFFVKTIIDTLQANTAKYLSASDLQILIAPQVKRDAHTRCMIKSLDIQDTQNGQFYFKLGK